MREVIPPVGVILTLGAAAPVGLDPGRSENVTANGPPRRSGPTLGRVQIACAIGIKR